MRRLIRKLIHKGLVFRKLLIFALVMAVVGAGGWFGRKVYKRATERRLIGEARLYLGKKDFKNAGLSLQRARQINPMSVQASSLTADFLEDIGAPGALNWRIRTAQLETNNVEHRYAWAQTALKMQEPQMAAQALRGVEEKYRSSATFHKLAGALAWSAGARDEADKQYQEALRLEPTNQVIVLDLATVRLASTNAAVEEAARLSLEQIPAASPLRPLARRYLVADAEGHKFFAKAIGYSKELLDSPAAAYGDKIIHLRLLREAASPEAGPWLASLKDDATRSPEHAYALGRWLFAENPTNTFQWLQSLPRTVQTNQPVPLLISDCQISLKDWSGLLGLVQKHDWGDAEYYRLFLESVAQRSLGQDMAAKAAWQKAFRTANRRLDRLVRLNQLTAAWKWDAERAEVLSEIVDKYPREKWAAEQWTAELYAAGNSHELAKLAVRLQADNPNDPRLKNNVALISLLRKTDLERAHKLAREAYEASPENPFFVATYAYSLLLRNQTNESVKIVSALKPEALRIPTVALYYGVVQVQAGNKGAAKAPLELACSAKLLPEEMEIARLARGRL